MPAPSSVVRSLADDIVGQLENLLLDAVETTKPLELDPYRSRIFELFVTAEGAGLLESDSDPDLSADGISRELAERWNLATVMEDSVRQQTKLDSESLARMRILWSFLRMWMEWTYAWQRWAEFHPES